MSIVYRLILPFAIAVALLFVDGGISGQPFSPVPVAGLSTGSVYDLLADRRGFIWVAHETGISRYDGNSFTHFYCDQQTGLAMTDIIEDRQGRIWCHNFNGQLFYIEHEKMYLLEAYNSRKEKTFQRTVLLGDELLSTSAEGLFICNTKNLKCRVERVKGFEVNHTESIAVVGDKAVAAGENWFSYQPETGLKMLKVDPRVSTINIRLQPFATEDTLYAIENPHGDFRIYKFVVEGDSVTAASRIFHDSRVNTITQDAGRLYINANLQTISTNGRTVASGYDLTDIVTDWQGNRWYSSLQKGLLFEQRTGMWEKIRFPELEPADFIRSLSGADGVLICGTNKGRIYIKDVATGRIRTRVQVPKPLGAIQNLYRFGKNGLGVVTSIGMLLLDIGSGKFRIMSDRGTIKNIAITPGSVLLAYADCLNTFPATPAITRLLDAGATIDIDLVADDCVRMIRQESALQQKRCKQVCYNQETKMVYASFLDGIYSWKDGQFRLLQYENKPAHAFTMVESAGRIILSSFQGLFFLHGNQIVPFKEANLLKTSFVTSMKVHQQYLFLIESDKIRVIDTGTEALLNTIPLPENYNGLVYNIEVVGDKLYLANPMGLYAFDFSLLKSNTEVPPVNYLLSVTANGKDIVTGSPVLKPSENNLQFKFAAPGYLFPAHTFFYYQLKGSNDTTWRKMNKASFILSLASLNPGDYTLNAYAVNYRMQKAVRPISFHFVISKPWWQQTWFMLLVIALVMLATYLIVSYRYRIIRRRTREKEQRQQQFETALLQSQIVVQEQERKRIAEDLHDDIGATLSALHLHISNLPEHTLATSPDLQSFYKHSLSLASKAASDVRDISHDLMPKDFSVLGLFAVLQNRMDELNASNSVRFIFISDGDEKTLNNIYSVTIYRIVNELISNIIRHAQAQQASIQILITEAETQVIVEDNGIGMQQIQGQRGIGMKNIYSRVDFLKGTMHVDSSEKGTAIIITIPMNREAEDAGATPE